MAASIADLHEVIALAESGDLRVEVELFDFDARADAYDRFRRGDLQESSRRHSERLIDRRWYGLRPWPGWTTCNEWRRRSSASRRSARGRDAARNRAERSGVFLSRPAISLLSALHAAGPVRLSRLSDLTDLEAPLVSREIAGSASTGT